MMEKHINRLIKRISAYTIPEKSIPAAMAIKALFIIKEELARYQSGVLDSVRVDIDGLGISQVIVSLRTALTRRVALVFTEHYVIIRRYHWSTEGYRWSPINNLKFTCDIPIRNIDVVAALRWLL
jgi:hypothetical protein